MSLSGLPRPSEQTFVIRTPQGRARLTPSGSSSSSDSASDAGSESKSGGDTAILRHLERMDAKFDAKFDKVTADFAGLSATVEKLKADRASSHPSTPAPPGRTPGPRAGLTLEAAVGKIASLGAGGAAAPGKVPLGAKIKDHLRHASASFGDASAKPVIKPKGRSRRVNADSDSESSLSGTDRRSRRKARGRSGSRRDRAKDDDEPSLDGPLAPGVIQKLYYGHFRSAYEYVEHQPWENPRNKHEARRHAQVLDSFMFAGATADMEGIEILCRNISALGMADQAKDMSLLEVIEYDPPGTLLPPGVRRSAFKDAERLKKTRAGPRQSGGGAGGSGGQSTAGRP